jgi:hypothetical protein
MDKQLIVRLKKSERPEILTVQNSRDAKFFMANLRQIPSISHGRFRWLHDGAYHEDDQCADENRENKSALASMKYLRRVLLVARPPSEVDRPATSGRFSHGQFRKIYFDPRGAHTRATSTLVTRRLFSGK